MHTYTRKINYYETDMMGVTHHANYIHLMEEARIDYMDKLGYGYARLESEGVGSPVTGLSAKYHAPTTFDDEVTVRLRIAQFNGVILTIAYEILKADGTRAFSGTSEHCFLTKEGRFARLKRDYPELYQLLIDHIEPENTENQ